MGEKLPRILPKVATSTSLLGSFTCRKFKWDRRLYFPSEGRSAEDFFARKIQRLRPGLNPRTRVPEASTLTSRPPNIECIYLLDFSRHVRTVIIWITSVAGKLCMLEHSPVITGCAISGFTIVSASQTTPVFHIFRCICRSAKSNC